MKYFLIAGEASGDLHASSLMQQLKQQDAEAEFCYLGGDLMQAQGGSLVCHYRNMAFMGILAVALNLRKIFHNLQICKKSIVDFQPDALILIDYPSFNLRIAKYVKEKLPIPIFYYIPPKLWAWKEYRIKQIKKYVNKVFCILPFEPDFYKKHHYPVEYVGNPCVDAISNVPVQIPFETFVKENRLVEKPIIALLAGSRKQEIKSCLPKMLQTAKYFPDFQFVVAGAPGIDENFYRHLLPNKSFNIVFDKTYLLLQQSTAAVVNSGTATLETALLQVPQVVVYHVFGGPLALLMKKLVLKINYVSLVNLIAEKEIVTELIASNFTVANLTEKLHGILFDENIRTNIALAYTDIQQKCGLPGAAKNTAEKIYNYLIKNHLTN